MIRCPKCKAKGSSIVLQELWRDHVIEFDQRDDGTVEAKGILKEGSAYGVQAWCLECQKKWRLRGVTQITNLPRYAAALTQEEV